METIHKIHLHHVALQTSCFEKAFNFYTELLGLRVVKEPFTFKGKRTLAWLDAGGIMIEIYSVKDGEEPQPYDNRRVGTDHIAFEVQDIDAAIAYLSHHNVRILRQPFLPLTDDTSQPRVAMVEGPDGEEIEIREYLRS